VKREHSEKLLLCSLFTQNQPSTLKIMDTPLVPDVRDGRRCYLRVRLSLVVEFDISFYPTGTQSQSNYGKLRRVGRAKRAEFTRDGRIFTD
jgi:hypothetical protein